MNRQDKPPDKCQKEIPLDEKAEAKVYQSGETFSKRNWPKVGNPVS